MPQPRTLMVHIDISAKAPLLARARSLWPSQLSTSTPTAPQRRPASGRASRCGRLKLRMSLHTSPCLCRRLQTHPRLPHAPLAARSAAGKLLSAHRPAGASERGGGRRGWPWWDGHGQPAESDKPRDRCLSPEDAGQRNEAACGQPEKPDQTSFETKPLKIFFKRLEVTCDGCKFGGG